MRRIRQKSSTPRTSCFNPLFIGSKDATTGCSLLLREWKWFQSPFHRVKGCDPPGWPPPPGGAPVSIPFSSGQRMRHGRAPLPAAPRSTVSIPFSSGQRMRPTLHSVVYVRPILFQSSFHRVKGCDQSGRPCPPTLPPTFQSPFHRVKGCDQLCDDCDSCHACMFQSPFHRVKGCDSPTTARPGRRSSRFNPLFIGSKDATGKLAKSPYVYSRSFNPLFIGSKDATWLPVAQPALAGAFQSPFHRVKGCDGRIPAAGWRSPSTFQSPFHRVKGCDKMLQQVKTTSWLRFNPLFIGSKDATYCHGEVRFCAGYVSIPFSSGQRMRR